MKTKKRTTRKRTTGGETTGEREYGVATQTHDGEALAESERPLAVTTPDPADGGEGRVVNDHQNAADAEVVQHLRNLQAGRVNAMRALFRLNNATLAYIRTTGGWQWNQDEKSRAKQNARAKAILDHISDSKTLANDSDADLALLVKDFVLLRLESMRIEKSLVANTERQMKKLARTLPVYAWVKQTKGFSDMTLGVLVGECGDFAGYPSWKHLAKRMGLAPYKGRMGATWKSHCGKKDALKADEWVEFGYVGRRRSIMYTLGEAQIRNRTPYRDVYEQWKEQELARTDENKPQSQMHAHRRALIVMERRMIRELYEAWRLFM